ncbi:MAG TPA: hypothetical protein PKY29_08440 [Ferruginibacter sp.]|nr:hypothetical protein [Ferruginibacter sp.]HRO18114.1 hypothetical protein [Ferruginibacter sp.]HRQ21330.1 hypothetical protein [Ferruginibacter sp.]
MYKFEPGKICHPFKPLKTNKLTEKIPIEAAQTFINNYRDTFEFKGAEPDSYIRSFFIDKKAIDSIFEKAKDHGIVCKGLRIYIGKKMPPSEDDIRNPIMDTGGKYNLVVAGVDDTECTITETEEIYDNFSSCPTHCPPKSDFCL